MNYEKTKKINFRLFNLQASGFRIKGGFTLLEVMVAISVMTLAVAGSFILIQQTLVAASLNQSKLIASYLAQEGFEIVRNIRDSNWLEQRYTSGISWDDGISNLLSPGDPPKDYVADYQSQELIPITETEPFLNLYEDLDGNDFYSYSPGQPTVFKRKISITKINDDSIQVEVLVEWSERGRNHNFSAQEFLYNWYKLE